MPADALHARVSSATLGVVRVAVFAMWWKHLFGDSFERYARIPFELFTPIGPLLLVPEDAWSWIYTPGFMEGARYALLAGVSACLLGVRPYRPIAIATCTGLIAYQALVRGYGYMYHGELAMLFAAFVVAVFPSARGFALSPRSWRAGGEEDESVLATNRAAMWTLCTIFLLTYCFVGVNRVLSGGVEIFRDGTILHMIARYAFADGVDDPGIGRFVLEVPALGHLVAFGFAATTFFEFFAPVALFFRSFRWLWIAAVLGFHVASGVLMGIWFTANMALVLLCMTDLEFVLARVNAAFARLAGRPLPFLPGGA